MSKPKPLIIIIGIITFFLITITVVSLLSGSDKSSISSTSRQKSIHDIQFIKLNAGSFMMGSTPENLEDENEGPLHKVDVNEFYISKTEITVKQYQKCVDAGVCTKPHWDDETCWIERLTQGVLSQDFRGDDQPIVCVDWHQARKYAQWIGGDLPSEAQWEYAAKSRGKNILYPWGNEMPNCELLVHHFYRDCEIKSTSPVCSKPKGNTDQGICDMSGNVWEWTLDEYHDDYDDLSSHDNAWCINHDCQSKISTNHITRGGAWNNDMACSDLLWCSRNSVRIAITDISNDQGFRVAMVNRYKIQDKSLYQERLKKDPSLFYNLEDALYDDLEIALIAIQQNIKNYHYLSDRLKQSPDIQKIYHQHKQDIIQSIQSDPSVFLKLDPVLHDDLDIALAGIHLDLKYYDHLSNRLKIHQDIIKAYEKRLNLHFVKIKGGSFQMKKAKKEGKKIKEYLETVVVDDFSISNSEVTVSQYLKCVEAGVCTLPNASKIGEHVYNDVPFLLKQLYPMTSITFNQARTYAKWVRGDLPTKAQWEYAMKSNPKYLTQNHPEGYVCDLDDHMEYLDRIVCSDESDRTEDGLFGMFGNVFEWVLNDSIHPNTIINGVGNYVRGYEFLHDGVYDCEDQDSMRYSINDYDDENLGFRVVKR